MSLKDKLMEDLKVAMREKDKVRKDTITLVRAAIKQREVDERTELDDAAIEAIIAKQVKERKGAIEEFKKGERQDLIDAAEAEIHILLDYLPEQLSEEELLAIVREVVQEEGITSKKEIGRLMKAVMPKVQGRADGKRVNQIALTILD